MFLFNCLLMNFRSLDSLSRIFQDSKLSFFILKDTKFFTSIGYFQVLYFAPIGQYSSARFCTNWTYSSVIYLHQLDTFKCYIFALT
jgi:hypothetical protein